MFNAAVRLEGTYLPFLTSNAFYDKRNFRFLQGDCVYFL